MQYISHQNMDAWCSGIEGRGRRGVCALLLRCFFFTRGWSQTWLVFYWVWYGELTSGGLPDITYIKSQFVLVCVFFHQPRKPLFFGVECVMVYMGNVIECVCVCVRFFRSRCDDVTHGEYMYILEIQKNWPWILSIISSSIHPTTAPCTIGPWFVFTRNVLFFHIHTCVGMFY